MAELRIVMNHQPGSLTEPSRAPTIWMSFIALDFTRMAGGAPFVAARWRCLRGVWTRWG